MLSEKIDFSLGRNPIHPGGNLEFEFSNFEKFAVR